MKNIETLHKGQLSNQRFILPDQIRGVAVALMIFFHLFYDLNLFGVVNIDFRNTYFWWGLPRVIVALFLFCVGISLAMVHFPKYRWIHFIKRFLKLIFLAALISIVTYILFPDRWIYFGTLHCIATISVISLPFIRLKYISLIIGIIILVFDFSGIYKIPFIQLNHSAMDYIPPFPWTAAALIGISAYHFNFHKIPLPINFKFLSFLGGKNALLIYMIHQPILFSIAWCIAQVVNFIL